MATGLIKEDLLETVEASFKLASTTIKNLYLFTVNHKTAPIPIREKFAIPDYTLNDAIKLLKSYKSISSFLILSTCNRTEIFFTAENEEKALNDIYKFFGTHLGLEEKIVKEYNKIFSSLDVVNHAFKLACGLDSLVIGESQVLSQVKNAYSSAQKENTLDKTLEVLFQGAIKAAKDIHKKTNLSKNSQSISSAAINLTDKIAGPLKTKSIMVLGAGNMAKLALEHIIKTGGSKETVVLNRSPHRVIEFSESYKIDKSVPFENIYDVLNEIDILICAAGAPHFIVFAEEFKKVRKDPKKPLFIIDISMPRNIDSEFGKLENIKLMDIDSLQEIYHKTTQVQKEDLLQSEKIIETGIDDFCKKVSNEDTQNLIKDLKENAEKVRQDKLTKLIKEKTSFTKEEVDYITKNIVNAMIHEQIKHIKECSSRI